MTGMTGILSAFGLSAMYVFANLTDWRTIALFCSAAPVITSLALFYVRFEVDF